MLNPEPPPGSAAGDLAEARLIHQLCERFEAAWRSGERPRAEDSLAELPGPPSPKLVEELLALEIELRRERGERPIAFEYLARFPERREVVAALFADAPPGERDLDATAAWPPPRPPSTLIDSSPPRPIDAAAVDPASTPAPGRWFGKYELVAEIARGGMGVVYRARDSVLNRVVALKMILNGAAATADERQRFQREAQLVANLDHPNVVPIHEVGEHDGFPYFSMRLIEGGSLADRLADYRDDPRAAAQLVAILARAIQFANEKGFIHCDLKPSNILMEPDGSPRITDFGLARHAAEASGLTVSGAILGTPSYMAPEQASGRRRELGPATDVYGLGAILYELLTGRPPFRLPTKMETVLQALYGEPIPPRQLRPDLPRELESICLKCLEKAPKDRHPTAAALADELTRWLQGDAVGSVSPAQKLRRWTRREPEVVSRLAGLGLVSVLTELNYRVFSTAPDARAHASIQVILALWAALALLFAILHRRARRSDGVRSLWSAADMLCLTLSIWVLEAMDSPLLIGYPLMVAASGLWFRERIVWLTAAMAAGGYLALYVLQAVEWSGANSNQLKPYSLSYANIFVACLALTGFVVVEMIKRIKRLSRYYEVRQNVRSK